MTRTVELPYSTLPSFKPLFLDYLHRFEALSPFFPGDPALEDSWRRVASELDGRSHPRAEVSRSLREVNERLGADEAALASIAALEKGALAVVTGQQVGLLGGPLYTLYKGLTAVRLARWAATVLDRPVVPVFWMDADDHDFAEVQSAHLLDKDHELKTLRLDAEDASERLPVGARKLSPSVDDVVAGAADALPPSEFSEEVLRALRECYAPGRTMAEAFGSWLLRLTEGSGLVVVDPCRAELKRVASGLFEREVSESSESSGLVVETTEALLGLGYHAQANPSQGQLNLFYADPERFPIAFDDGGLQLSPGGRRHSREEVARRAKEEPERFSPNVLLRPLYQDTLFPTLAYVAGPNELAYFAQLGGVYRHFGVTMPLVASRASFTVIERPQERFLERYGVDFTKLGANDESLLNDILRELSPPQLDEDLSRARSCIQEITKSLEKDLARVDPTLVPTVNSTRGKMLHQLKELESKALRAVKRKNDTVRNQFLSTRTALYPGFSMQERKLSPVSFVNKHGWHFAKLVEEAASPGVKSHRLIYL